MTRLERNAPTILLGVALLASSLLLLTLTSGLTFFQDTWSILMNRRELTVDAVLTPHNEHIIAAQVLAELIFLRLFGMSSALPEFILLVVALAASATLLFVYARRRVGPWPALFAATLLLFVGPAWQVLLWPFELCFVGSVAFGLAVLLALDRDDRRGDLIASASLFASLFFSTLGVAFVVAAGVNVLQRARERGLGRVWILAPAVAFFVLWYLGWGGEAENHLSLRNVLESPTYVMTGLAAGVESVLGLSTAPVEGALADPAWGRPLLLILLVLVVVAQIRRPGFSPGLWPVAAAAATSWFLAAFNYIPGREPTSSRYMYTAAVFILLLAIELLRGIPWSRRALVVAGVVTIAAAGSNLTYLQDGKRWFENQTVLTRADTAAIEIARRTVAPEFRLAPEIASTPSLIDISAGPYLEASDEYGSPAYTEDELVSAPEVGRRAADIVLSQALPLSTRTYVDAAPQAGARGCVAGAQARAEGVEVGPGTTRIEVAPGPAAEFSLRRFALEEFPVPTEGAPGGSTTLLEIPADELERPWVLRVQAEQPVRICR